MGIKNIQGDLNITGNLQVSGINIKNEDESLGTSATTLVGAINEVNSKAGSGEKFSVAYQASSVDELPTDAVEGSFAVVKIESTEKIWVFHDELDNLGESYNAWGPNDEMNYVSPFNIKYSPLDLDSVEYDSFAIGTQGSSSWGIYTLYFWSEDYRMGIYTHNPSGSYGISHGWINDDGYKTIIVHEADEEAKSWLESHATESEDVNIITTAATLYVRVDGKWVEVNPNGEDNSTENPMLCVTVDNDYSTTMSAIITAIEEAGGDISKYNYVQLTGDLTDLLLIQFSSGADDIYTITCIDAIHGDRIHNPNNYNNIEVSTKTINDFLEEGRSNSLGSIPYVETELDKNSTLTELYYELLEKSSVKAGHPCFLHCIAGTGSNFADAWVTMSDTFGGGLVSLSWVDLTTSKSYEGVISISNMTIGAIVSMLAGDIPAYSPGTDEGKFFRIQGGVAGWYTVPSAEDYAF